MPLASLAELRAVDSDVHEPDTMQLQLLRLRGPRSDAQREDHVQRALVDVNVHADVHVLGHQP